MAETENQQLAAQVGQDKTHKDGSCAADAKTGTYSEPWAKPGTVPAGGGSYKDAAMPPLDKGLPKAPVAKPFKVG